MTLTDTHLIYRVNINQLHKEVKEIGSSQPVHAMNIKKGDFVLVNDEIKGIMMDEVVSNHIEIRKGFSAVITSLGNIVVDDILASCYTDYNHSFVHMVFAPFRWLYDAKNILSSMTKIENRDSSERVGERIEFHWYPDTLLTLMDNLFPGWQVARNRQLKVVC